MTISLLLLSGLLINPVLSETIEIASDYDLYVDDDYNSSTPGWGVDCFNIIQDAINAASDGDTIFVYGGEYTKKIVIDKSITLEGENKDITIINVSYNKNVDESIYVTKNLVKISGFTIRFSEENKTDGFSSHTSYTGLILESNNNQISNNIIKEFNLGIICSGDENNISNNKIFLNGNGITSYGDENNISNNEIFSNRLGITVGFIGSWSAIDGDTIYKNNIFLNEVGISVGSPNNVITGNILSNNKYGIFLNRCEDNKIFKNHISDNEVGISTNTPDGHTKVNKDYDKQNIIQYNNFIENNDSILYYYNNQNKNFRNNYWDDWKGLTSSTFKLLPYRIKGTPKIHFIVCDGPMMVGFPVIIPILCLNFDLFPASESFEIDLNL